MTARTLRTGRSGTVALVSDFVSSTSHANSMIRGALDALRERDTVLFTVDTQGDVELEAQLLESLLGRTIDGVLYASMFTRAVTPPAQLEHVPFVLLNCVPTDVTGVSAWLGWVPLGARSLDQRTFVPALHGFLDRVRHGHPDTPIVLASSILWPGSEHVPGPPGVEFLDHGRVRCYAAGERISYLDGLGLFGPGDTGRFTLPDSLHPDTALYAELGRRWAERVFGGAGLVPRARLAG